MSENRHALALSRPEVDLAAWSLADRERRETQFDLLRDDFNLWFDLTLRHGGLATDPAAATWRMLDAGCGRGQYAYEIAARYPRAAVTAYDVDAGSIAGAKAGADAAGGGPRFLVHDGREPLPADVVGGGFDVVLAWLILLWVPDKPALLRGLAAATRPGGVILLANLPDGFFQHPHPVAARMFATGSEALAREGGFGVADRLDADLRRAGFETIATVRPRFTVGGATAIGQRWWRHWVASLAVARRAVVDVHGLMSGEEFDGHVRTLSGQSMIDQAGHFDHLYTVARRVH
jgi:SAM-dependent methyltransferase